MSSTIIIDPDGDIALQLVQEKSSEDAKSPDEETTKEKPDARELIVSSKVLSLASPVFKAMLSKNFKEGKDLAKGRSSSKPYTLVLYGDDTEAAILFLKVLHFTIIGLPDKPAPVLLEKIAFLCDKYDCTDSMKYCGLAWLGNWLAVLDKDIVFIDDGCRLLVFAYVIDLSQEFSAISWGLLLNHKGPFTTPSDQITTLRDHPLLRRDILRLMNIKRARCCEMLHAGVIAPVSWEWHTTDDWCYSGAKSLGSYFDTLRRFKVMPYDLQFSNHAIRDVLEGAKKVHNTWSHFPLCDEGTCICDQDPLNLTEDLMRYVDLIMGLETKLLCLGCLKMHGASGDEGTCETCRSWPRLKDIA